MKDQEVLASILRKIKAMACGLDQSEAERAREEREWARRRG